MGIKCTGQCIWDHHTWMFPGAPRSEQNGLSWEEGKRRELGGGEVCSFQKTSHGIQGIKGVKLDVGGFKASAEFLCGCRSLAQWGNVCAEPKPWPIPRESSWDAGTEL